MGCTSAKLSFREGFDGTREAFTLDAVKDYTATPSTASSASRAECFATAQRLAAAGAQQSPHSSDGAGGTYSDHTVPTIVFLHYAERHWRLSAIHAFHCVWPAQCALTVTRQRRGTMSADVASNTLAVWEVRTWMLMTCEGLHVLALLEESKALPRSARKAFSALRTAKRPYPAGQFPASPEALRRVAASSSSSKDVLTVFHRCAMVPITPKHLTKAFLAQLAYQMPLSLSATNGPGLAVTAEASAIVRGAAAYWQSVPHDSDWTALLACSNPLQQQASATATPTGKQTAVAPSSGGCCGGASSQLSVPLLGLVEWLSLRLARACQGVEENASQYTSSLPDESASGGENGSPNGKDDAAAAVALQTTLGRLAWVLRRMHELEAALASGTLTRRVRSELEAEKASLEAELQALFDKVTNGHAVMDKQAGRDGLYDALSLAALFPIKAVHDDLSDCAYDTAIGYDAVRDRCEAPNVQNLWRFRLYLTAYLALTDLYGDVVTHHGVAMAGDVVDPLTFDLFFPVLQSVQARDPAVLATVPIAGDHQGDADTGRIISLFEQLAHMKSGDERTDHLVDFPALCQFVAQRQVAMYMVERPPLRALDALREELVVAEGTQTRDLEGCAARFRQALAPLAASPEAISQVTLVNTLVAQTVLFNYTYSAFDAADEAVTFSALVERTLPPITAPAAYPHTGEDTTPSSTACVLSAPACAAWLARACAEEKPLFANVAAYSLYAATAVYRCVEDTKPPSPYDAVTDGAPYKILDGDTPLSFEWFLAALTYISDALQLDATALVANVSNVLEARDAMLTGWTRGVDEATAAALDERNRGSVKERTEDSKSDVARRSLLSTTTSAAKAVTDAAHVTRAFADMTRFSAALDTAATPHHADRLSLNESASSLTGSVRLRDLAYVCVFQYTRAFFGGEPTLRLFFSSDAHSAQETRQLDADDAALRRLLTAMPLHDEELAYAEFFVLSGGARAVCLEDVPLNPDEEIPVRRFCTALFDRYREHLTALAISEESLLALCRDAIERVGTVVPSSCGNTRQLLFARDYRRFLQYVAGALLARGTYDALSASRSSEAVLDADGQPIRVVDTDFVRRLLYFLEQEQGANKLTDDNQKNNSDLDAAAVFNELLQKDPDLCGEAVSLQTVSAWYGQLRAAQTPQCVLDWWTRCAAAIPWTNSDAHCAARKDLEAAASVAMWDALSVPKTDATAAAPQSFPGDGYLPRAVVASTLREEYPDLYWAATVMRLGARALPPPPLTDRIHKNEGGNAGQSDAGAEACDAHQADATPQSDAWWEEWVRVCVERCNVLVARDDLGDTELHVRDGRLCLTYMHHYATTFFASQEAHKEVRAMRTAAAAGHAEGSMDCHYHDADFQSAMRALSTHLLGATVASNALEAAMTALHCYGLAHPDEVISDDTLAHLLTGALVQHAEQAGQDADNARCEEEEAARLKPFEREAFLGTTQFNERRAVCGTYWERLRLILPSGDSQKHRQLRREIFERMDVRRRGYLTMSDIYQGALDVLHLDDYRVDVLPVLFRAFFATIETATETATDADHTGTGTHTSPATANVIFLDADGDRVLFPLSLRMFFGYVYRYMELYFMFDALTASGQIDGHTLTVSQANALPTTGRGTATTGIARAAAAVLEPVPTPLDASEAPYSDGDALFLAAQSPYRLTMETANLPKEVSLAQFAAAHRILRYWGVRVHPEEVETVFKHVSRRSREQNAMHFTAFAIWASERSLRPEGYAHDHTVPS